MSQTWKAVLWHLGLIVIFGTLSVWAYCSGHSTLSGALVLVPGSMIINGYVAEAEAKEPGGFNNPTGDLANSTNDRDDHRNDPRDPTP